MAQYNTPADLKYTKSDEWIRLENDEAVIGVTDYAQHALSDVVYLELPDMGATFSADDAFGSIESVKAASDLHLPVGGKVIAVNDAPQGSPELVNKDPYGQGWLIRIKPSDVNEVSKLMSAEAYDTYCAERD